MRHRVRNFEARLHQVDRVLQCSEGILREHSWILPMRRHGMCEIRQHLLSDQTPLIQDKEALRNRLQHMNCIR